MARDTLYRLVRTTEDQPVADETWLRHLVDRPSEPLDVYLRASPKCAMCPVPADIHAVIVDARLFREVRRWLPRAIVGRCWVPRDKRRAWLASDLTSARFKIDPHFVTVRAPSSSCLRARRFRDGLYVLAPNLGRAKAWLDLEYELILREEIATRLDKSCLRGMRLEPSRVQAVESVADLKRQRGLANAQHPRELHRIRPWNPDNEFRLRPLVPAQRWFRTVIGKRICRKCGTVRPSTAPFDIVIARPVHWADEICAPVKGTRIWVYRVDLVDAIQHRLAGFVRGTVRDSVGRRISKLATLVTGTPVATYVLGTGRDRRCTACGSTWARSGSGLEYLALKDVRDRPVCLDWQGRLYLSAELLDKIDKAGIVEYEVETVEIRS